MITDERRRLRGSLRRRATVGEKLLVGPGDLSAFQPAALAFKTWHEGNTLYVSKIFDPQSADLYLRVYLPPANLFARPGNDVEKHNRAVREFIRRLESMADNIEQLSLVVPPPEAVRSTETNSRVFLVHGRDEGLLAQVARFLESRLKLEVTILDEQPSEGRTVIEKIEAFSGARFAVVLMTPDDEGRLAGSGEPVNPRARQNVVFELGFFMGLLTRKNVCVIDEPNMPEFSDLAGVVTVLPRTGWELRLAKEIRASGIEVDFNSL